MVIALGLAVWVVALALAIAAFIDAVQRAREEARQARAIKLTDERPRAAHRLSLHWHGLRSH